jgi:hypothetical protein
LDEHGKYSELQGGGGAVSLICIHFLYKTHLNTVVHEIKIQYSKNAFWKFG